MNRSITELRELFDDLVEIDEESRPIIPRSSGDYEVRTGLTHCPMVSSVNVTKNVTVTHSYIRILNFIENLIWHLNAEVLKLGRVVRYTNSEKEALHEAKELFRKEAAHGPLNMKLACPDAYGAGGCSDTAELSRRFLKNEMHC